jgi:DNA-binding transcriptional LysR family regulator
VNLKEIEYILTIAQEGNLTRAARKLFIAQPSLSQSLKRIEADMGAMLFLRERNRMKLTKEGELFVDAGRSILRLFDEMKNSIGKSKGNAKRSIHLGSPPFLGSFLFPQIMVMLHNRSVDIDVQLMEGSSLELENKLLCGEIELAMLPMPLINNCLSSWILHTSRMVLLVSSNDPINRFALKLDDRDYPYLDIRLLNDKDFLVGKPGQRVRQINEIIFKKAQIEPRMVFCSQSIDTIKRISATGAGVSILPEYYLEKLGSLGDVNCYNLAPEYSHEWLLAAISRSFDDLSIPALYVLQVLIDLFDREK